MSYEEVQWDVPNSQGCCLGPKPKDAGGTQREFTLVLLIDDTAYVLGVIPDAGYSLKKGDGTAYQVTKGEWGPCCDCPDWCYKREGLDPNGCKHVRALKHYGMI
jgi:hypothetical protein